MKNWLAGVNIFLGLMEDLSLLLSELAGCYRVVLVVKEICTQYGIQEGKIEIACDDIKELRQVMDLDYFVSQRYAHFDLTMAIWALFKENPLKLRIWHVKGHQDQDPYKVLDQWASLNIEVNLLAHACWHETKQIPLQQCYNICLKKKAESS